MFVKNHREKKYNKREEETERSQQEERKQERYQGGNMKSLWKDEERCLPQLLLLGEVQLTSNMSENQ
jgi:hypothetical protein